MQGLDVVEKTEVGHPLHHLCSQGVPLTLVSPHTAWGCAPITHYLLRPCISISAVTVQQLFFNNNYYYCGCVQYKKTWKVAPFPTAAAAAGAAVCGAARGHVTAARWEGSAEVNAKALCQEGCGLRPLRAAGPDKSGPMGWMSSRNQRGATLCSGSFVEKGVFVVENELYVFVNHHLPGSWHPPGLEWRLCVESCKKSEGNGQKRALAPLSAWVFSHTAKFSTLGFDRARMLLFPIWAQEINSFRLALAAGGWAQPRDDAFAFGPRSAPWSGSAQVAQSYRTDRATRGSPSTNKRNQFQRVWISAWAQCKPLVLRAACKPRACFIRHDSICDFLLFGSKKGDFLPGLLLVLISVWLLVINNILVGCNMKGEI